MTETTLEDATGITAQARSPLPDYMANVYDWAYVNPRWVHWLDSNVVVKALLFGQDRRLMHAYLNSITPGMRIWQVAHVYGDLAQRAAQRCGLSGAFHLTDITPIQVTLGLKKLREMPWAYAFKSDAATFSGHGAYDLICSFFLLHEVPDEWKRSIVDNMLKQLSAHGELLFVDYHRPAWWQPVRLILKVINRRLEPFADSLWQHDIAHFASHAEQYTWSKRTIFGGVYQIVRVARKTSLA